MGPMGCTATSVRNCHYQPRNNRKSPVPFPRYFSPAWARYWRTAYLCRSWRRHAWYWHYTPTAATFTFTAISDFSNLTLTDIMFYPTNATVYRKINTAPHLIWFLNCPPTCVFIWDFSGRRSHGRPLKRLLDVRDGTGPTLGPTAWQLHDDEDENVSTIFVHYRGVGGPCVSTEIFKTFCYVTWNHSLLFVR